MCVGRQGVSAVARRVVVGDDGSRVAEAAVMWAADEAARRSVALTIVGCSSMSPQPGDRATVEAAESAVRDIRYRLERVAGRVRARRPQLAVMTSVILGRAAGALVAEAEDAELLVIGSSGTSGPPGYRLGTIAEMAIRTGRCPVAFVSTSRTFSAHPQVVLVGEGDVSAASIEAATFETELVRGDLRILADLASSAVADVVRDADLVIVGSSDGVPATSHFVNSVIGQAACPVVVGVERRPHR